MSTSIMFLPFAIFSARMRKLHMISWRFFISATVAFISWELAFCITVITVWTSPGIECHQIFSLFLFSSLNCFTTIFIVITSILYVSLNLFFFIILFFFFNLSIFSCIKFLDPSLNTSKMERLTTLFTVP